MPDISTQPLPPVWEGKPPAAALPAPGLLYLTGEEFLRASFMANTANITVQVTGRVLAPDNTIKRYTFTLTPAGNRTFTSAVTGLSSGWLLDFTARASAGAPPFGSIYGIFEIGIGQSTGFLPMQTLREGFFTTNTPLSCATSISMLPLDGPGALRSITGTTPGAGAELSETVPAGARWFVLSFRTRFVASAAVANRIPVLTIDDGVNLLYQMTGAGPITAGNTQVEEWISGVPVNVTFNSTIGTNPLPLPLWMAAGHRLRTVTSLIDVADQYSQVQYLVREWMTGE